MQFCSLFRGLPDVHPLKPNSEQRNTFPLQRGCVLFLSIGLEKGDAFSSQVPAAPATPHPTLPTPWSSDFIQWTVLDTIKPHRSALDLGTSGTIHHWIVGEHHLSLEQRIRWVSFLCTPGQKEQLTHTLQAHSHCMGIFYLFFACSLGFKFYFKGLM